ncbi:MAG: type VI secretion system baseplate subunit TssK [Chitinispirillales bacterium]|jgi:type VI secretion system protein ImpJ|nr:type VI secretion system baseplate subunit TssK [Chitinispirillales bacterium]
MPNNGKILWEEGMFLEPHHFQISERFQADYTAARVNSLSYAGFQYGFTELITGRDALLGGQFTIVRASGVFPDGTCFQIGDGAYSKPLSRSFSGYCRPDQQTLDVYFVIPDDGPGRPLHGDGSVAPIAEQRYVRTSTLVRDELVPDNSKEITVGVPNYQIRFEGEPLDGCTWLLVARLVRNGAGYMELERRYSPPVLFFRCSEAITDRVGGLLELLWAKMGSLGRCRGQSEQGRVFFSASEVGAFLLLNTLCSSTPLLNCICKLPQVHPFEIYAHLTTLYGSLLTFSPEISLDMIPQYDHDDLGTVFASLEECIRDALAAEFWTATAQMALERVNTVMWACRFPDEHFVKGVNLFIGVASETQQKALVVHVLQRMKVCSRDKLDQLVSTSSPGLTLIHAQKIPEGLAAKPGYAYFAVDKQSLLWRDVEASGTLGIYFPGDEYGDAKVELLALRHE